MRQHPDLGRREEGRRGGGEEGERKEKGGGEEGERREKGGGEEGGEKEGERAISICKLNH